MSRTQTQNLPAGERISLRNLIAMGLIPMGIQSLRTIVNNYGNVFFTDVMGVSTGMLGVVMLVLKIIDGINDPLLGLAMDNSPVTRFGKYRRFYLAASVGCILAAVLMFHPMGASLPMAGKVLLLAGSYFLFDISTTLAPFAPITANLSRDPSERRKATMIGRGSELAINTILALCGMPIIIWLGKGSDHSPNGWFYGVTASTLLFCIAAIIGTLLLKEHSSAQAVRHESKVSARDFVDMFRERTSRSFFILVLFSALGGAFLGIGGIYYVKYVYGSGRRGLVPFSIVRIVGNILGVLLAGSISKRFDHVFATKLAVRMTMGAMAALFVIGIFRLHVLPLFLLFVLCCSTGAGMLVVTQKTLSMEVMDYNQYIGKKRMEASISSLVSLAAKIQNGLATMILMGALTWSGYVANEALTDKTLVTILVVSFLLPVVFCIAGDIAVRRYPVTKELRADIMHTLSVPDEQTQSHTLENLETILSE